MCSAVSTFKKFHKNIIASTDIFALRPFSLILDPVNTKLKCSVAKGELQS